MSGSQTLDQDSVQYAAFEKIRTCGADRSDGQTIHHQGREYGLTVHRICKLETLHVVIVCLDESMPGYQQAMAVVVVDNNGYRGLDGASVLLPALLNGVTVKEPTFTTRSYRVLPWCEVPHVFANHQDTLGDAADC